MIVSDSIPYWRSFTICSNLASREFEELIFSLVGGNPELALQAKNNIAFRKLERSEDALLEFKVIPSFGDNNSSRAEFKVHVSGDIEKTTESCSDTVHKFIDSLFAKVKTN